MNRGFRRLFHSPAQSSYLGVVEQLWKLCQTGVELRNWPRLTLISGALQSDFSHKGSEWN
jgi:hypothetical protein